VTGKKDSSCKGAPVMFGQASLATIILNPNSALGEVLDRINKIHRMGYQE
jgi:hypothetical protein